MTDESLEGGVPGLTHIVGPVRPSGGGDVDVPHFWGEQGRLSSDPGWWYRRGGVEVEVVDDVVEIAHFAFLIKQNYTKSILQLITSSFYVASLINVLKFKRGRRVLGGAARTADLLWNMSAWSLSVVPVRLSCALLD